MMNSEEEERRSLNNNDSLENEVQGQYTGDGSVDKNRNPVLKHNTGNWKACFYILGNESCERFAYYGIATNLVTFLTQKLHEGNASAARKATFWQGTCYLTPLIGAFVADAYLGRYLTIAVFSIIYFIGMLILTFSAPASASGMFFLGLYLIALGTGGIKPCVSCFGADQFDVTDPQERAKKVSFFNWFYFSISIGGLLSTTCLVWVPGKYGWGLGFGIPTGFVLLAVISFYVGTPHYRFQEPGGSPLTRFCQVVIAAVRKRKVDVPDDSSLLYEIDRASRRLKHTDGIKFLDKAATVPDPNAQMEGPPNSWQLCTVTQVEELKIIIRMFPIWVTSIVFSAVYAQISTTFVEQGMVLYSTFNIPPAFVPAFGVLAVLVLVPLYDRILVPRARNFTGRERGFTELQRMGIGMFISVLAMSVAALVEIARLQQRKGITTTMSILWQIPQYVLIGAAEVFTFVGQLDFFNDQSPEAMRSLGLALSLSTTALGNYLSSLILTVVTSLTGWIPDDLNEGHLDYFFWLLAGLSLLNLLLYLFCAKRYRYRNSKPNVQ